MAEYFTLDFEGAEVGTLLAGARTLINGDAVRYSPQSASEAQKKQARANLGAASAAEVTNLAREIEAIEPVDVTALMTEGGTLAAEAVGGALSSLLTRPLYVKKDVYFSTVHVSVSDRVWYFVAHRIGYNADGSMYRMQRVAECTATDNVMTCNKVTEFKE